MANLKLASAVYNALTASIALTIGSTTTVTDPLQLTTGTHVTGLSLTADGQAVTIGTVNLPASGNVITIPVTGAIVPGQTLVLTAASSNLEDSAGSPLLLTNQTVTVSYALSSLQNAIATMFTNDPLIAILQTAADFGNCYNVGGSEFVVYDLDNKNLLATFKCTLGQGGTLTRLVDYALYTGSSYVLPGGATSVTNANVAALFTNDPLIAFLQAESFGPVVVQSGGRYKILALDGKTPIVELFAQTDSTGTPTKLLRWTPVKGTGPATVSGSAVTPGAVGTTNSSGAASNVELTSTSYSITKFCTIFAPLSNTGTVWVNTVSSYSQSGQRLSPGQSINIPVGLNLNSLYASFVAANDLVNYTAL